MMHTSAKLATNHLSGLVQFFLAILCICLNSFVVQAKPYEEGYVTGDRLQVDSWIVDLDADRYEIRKEAQRKLEQTGSFALEAVTQAASEGSLESSTRAINVLLAWTDSSDEQLRFKALESIASLKRWPREARIAHQLLSDARERAALHEIAKLGGTFNQLAPGAAILELSFGKQWKGGNSGLRHLANVPHATKLSFYSAPIDDGAIPYLISLGHVQRIELYGTRISQKAVNNLAMHLPDTTVDYRSGALLGIHGNLGKSALVEKVKVRSAADKAGIRKGDIITHVDKHKIDSFTQLTERIGKYQPGSSADLTIVRSDQTMVLKVKFDEWNNETAKREPAQVILPAIVPRRISIDRR